MKIPDMTYVAKQAAAWATIYGIIAGVAAAVGWVPLLKAEHELRVARVDRLLCEDIGFKLYVAEDSAERISKDPTRTVSPEMIKKLTDLRRDKTDFNCP